MSGALVGLLLGLGLLTLAEPVLAPSDADASEPARRRRAGGVRRRLDAAGLPDVAPARLVGTCVATGAALGALMLVLSGSLVVSLALGAAAASLPVAALVRRTAARRRARAACWPDAVDDLASAVRAGMSLPEAVAALADRGPETLRPSFSAFAAEHRATGSFAASLDVLKAGLADPVGDRVVEALRLAREVGGTELGRLLRNLSAVLREDARTRAELEARQSWAVNAARLAVAAPWATLALLSLRPGALSVYDSAGGLVVLAVAAVMSAAAYVVMRRIGRLPGDERVLA